MNDTRNVAVLAATAIMAVVLPCVAQEQPSNQATPDLSGTGNAGHIAVWKNSSTIGNSAISQSSGGIGIGTTTPAATLEVNGNAQVDGNFSLSGNILETGVGQLLWAPNDGSGSFSAGLGALPSGTTGGKQHGCWQQCASRQYGWQRQYGQRCLLFALQHQRVLQHGYRSKCAGT